MEQVIKLSRREKEIIILLSKATCRKIISRNLKISLHTVDAHLRHLRIKTNTHSIPELIIWALENNINKSSY
jgi:DNA-binding CsgD family transcriptional regulator